jgi:hypothetical protein
MVHRSSSSSIGDMDALLIAVEASALYYLVSLDLCKLSLGNVLLINFDVPSAPLQQ